MPYASLTYLQARNQLAGRLGDPDKVFWTDTELGVYIKDALQHWSLIAQYWKDTDVFSTVAGTEFYKPSVQSTLRASTLTDTDVIKAVQFHLMELAPGTSWTGTEQFTYQQILDALNRAMQSLLLVTAADLQVDTITSGSPPVSFLYLDASIIDLRRVAWKFPSGIAASGSIIFGGIPGDGDTITVNGAVFTFKNSPVGAYQIQIAGISITNTVSNAVTKLNASTDPLVSVATYTADDINLDITYNTIGTIGNSFTLASNTGTVSGPTLDGGTEAPARQYNLLRQAGPIQRRSFSPRSSYTPGLPVTYLKANQPAVGITLSPPSVDAGSLQIVTGRAKTTLNGQGNTLNIPDDFVPTLKWGILADLLSSEKAMDMARADYCEQRWREGLQAATVAPSLWSFEIEGKPCSMRSLAELDAFRPNWQNETGEPDSVAAAGIDLIALSPVPDAIYSVTMNVTRRPILPSADGDYIQIGQEYVNTLLDYCVHLAAFKQGPDFLAGTQSLLKGFLTAAALQNDRLEVQDYFADTASDQATREERFRPRQQSAVGGKQ